MENAGRCSSRLPVRILLIHLPFSIRFERKPMDLTFAHYRNRFCMFRTYYALAVGKVKPDGINMKVIELPDPPSKEQEEALIRGEVQAANLYLPNFLRRKLQGAPIIGLATEWKSTMKGNGVFVRADGPIKTPKDLEGRLIATHQGPHAIHNICCAGLRPRRREATLGGLSTGETSWRAAERQGGRRGAARSVFLPRRSCRRRALSLHRRRSLAKAAPASTKSSNIWWRPAKTCCGQSGHQRHVAESVSRVFTLTAKRISKRSPTSLSRVMAATVRPC